MKTAIITLFLAIVLTITGDAKDLTVGGEVFESAASPSSTQSAVEEYVLRGQSLKNWTRLISVRHFPNISSPKDYITNMAAEYRKLYPQMKFAVDQSDGRWFFDCIMYPRDNGPKFVEWNFFAVRVAPEGGIVVQQYAARAPYQSSVEEAFEALDVKSLRQRMLPILKKSNFATQP